MRIVSLIASATEIVSALGFQSQIVGRSHECDYPESILTIPACSEPKINIHTSSFEIDRQVKEVVAQSLSVYRVDADKLKKLKPDVIVTQDHCEVCAVSLKDVENAVCDWMENRPKIVSLRPESMDDIWKNIFQVADALEAQPKGEQLVRRLQARIDAITRKVEGVERPISVACIEWIDPLMAGGNWIPEMVHLLKADCVFGEPGKHSPWMTWEELVAKDPDVIITLPCGFDIKRTLEEMPLLSQRKEWAGLKAVRTSRVYVTDGNQYFNRPGPRLVESFEIMAEILYPDIFQFGYENTGWINYRPS